MGEKINHGDIASQNAFSDYAGPTKDFDAGVDYFIQKFKDCLIDDEFNDSFIHVTCATDTNNMEFVLESTRMIIMQDSLKIRYTWRLGIFAIFVLASCIVYAICRVSFICLLECLYYI